MCSTSQRRLVPVGHSHADALQELQSQRERNLSLGPNLVHSGIASWRRPQPPNSRGSNPQLHRHPRAFLTAEKVKLACMHCLAPISHHNCLSGDVAMHVMVQLLHRTRPAWYKQASLAFYIRLYAPFSPCRDANSDG